MINKKTEDIEARQKEITKLKNKLGLTEKRVIYNRYHASNRERGFCDIRVFLT